MMYNEVFWGMGWGHLLGLVIMGLIIAALEKYLAIIYLTNHGRSGITAPSDAESRQCLF